MAGLAYCQNFMIVVMYGYLQKYLNDDFIKKILKLWF
jgi:hypothetical protein